MTCSVIWNGNNTTEIAAFLKHDNFGHKNGELYIQTEGCLLVFKKGQQLTRIDDTVFKQDRSSAQFKSALRELLYEVSDLADIKETKLDEHMGDYDRDAWMLGRIIEASGLDIQFEWVKESRKADL